LKRLCEFLRANPAVLLNDRGYGLELKRQLSLEWSRVKHLDVLNAIKEESEETKLKVKDTIDGFVDLGTHLDDLVAGSSYLNEQQTCHQSDGSIISPSRLIR
jgi:hypothetical protein